MADAEDMREVCSGDEQAFGRVVRRYQHDIMAYCLRLVRDEAAAQDVAQEVFLTLWKRRRSYSEQGKLRYYLISIARLRSLALLKKSRSDARLKQQAAEVHATNSPARTGDDAGLQEALGRIQSKHRDLVVLRHLEGFDLAEIREITGLREGTIKSRLHRAMAALRLELSDE